MEVVTLKVVEVDPAGIMILTGVAAILVFELDSMIVAPPLEAVVIVPPVTMFGLRVTADNETPHGNEAPAPPNAKDHGSIQPTACPTSSIMLNGKQHHDEQAVHHFESSLAVYSLVASVIATVTTLLMTTVPSGRIVLICNGTVGPAGTSGGS